MARINLTLIYSLLFVTVFLFIFKYWEVDLNRGYSSTILETKGSTSPKITPLDYNNDGKLNGDDIDRFQVISGSSVCPRGKKCDFNADKKVTTADLEGFLRQRKEIMLDLVRTNPQKFLKNLVNKQKRDKLPARVQKYVEEEIIVEGELEVTIYDGPDRQNKNYYFLQTEKEKLNLVIPDGEPPMAVGARAQAKGYQLDDFFVLGISDLSILNWQNAVVEKTTGTQKLLFLLVSLADSPQPILSRSETEGVIRDGPWVNFYNENSYGKLAFTADVYGWYKLNRKSYEQPPSGGLGVSSSCIWPTINEPEMQSYIAKNMSKIDLNNYRGLVIVFNHPCALGAFGSVGLDRLTINQVQYRLSQAWVGLIGERGYYHALAGWNRFNNSLAHELGHNLGLLHANSIDCGPNALVGSCIEIAYGNQFDIMGSSVTALHFNAVYKDLLKWFSSDNITNINSSGRYILKPIESALDPRAARIRLGSNTEYYLEYRYPIGFDRAINDTYLTPNEKHGLFVYRVPAGYDIWDSVMSWLLDMRPGIPNDLFDELEASMNTFTMGYKTLLDVKRGIYIKLVSHDSNGAVVDVGIGPSQSPYDYNNDDLLNTLDLQYLLGVITNTRQCPTNKDCDLNNDGIRNTLDLIKLNRVVTNICQFVETCK